MLTTGLYTPVGTDWPPLTPSSGCWLLLGPRSLACCSGQEEPGPRACHTGARHLLGRLPKGHVVFLLRDKSRGQWRTRSSLKDRPELVVKPVTHKGYVRWARVGSAPCSGTGTVSEV